MQELDYNNFTDTSTLDRIPLVGKLASLIFEKGIYNGNFLETWLGELLKAKGVDTFDKLILEDYKDDDRYRFKLRVIASDITLGRMLVLPQDIIDYGVMPENLNVAFAVRMSMSIPFFTNR